MPIPLNGLLSSAMSFLPVMTNQTGFKENELIWDRSRTAPISSSTDCWFESPFRAGIFGSFRVGIFGSSVFAEIDSLVECSLPADAETLSVDSSQLIYDLSVDSFQLIYELSVDSFQLI